MKANLETVIGVNMTMDINISESPLSIIRKLYEDDPTTGSQFFANQKAIDQLMAGDVDEEKSSFELLTVEDDTIRAVWKEPLCNQPDIKQEISNIEAEGQIPTFVVSVTSIVANV